MTIIHVIDEFLRTLFPDIDIKNGEHIKKALTQYFTYDNYIPKVEIKDGFAYVEFDIDKLFEQKKVFDEVVVLCEKGRYDQAKPLLDELIEANPTNSEYYRIRGQIYSDEGNQEEAINYLIDALKWNPKNGWALLMIGNIFAKFKNDIDTAMKYYDQALKVNPDDNISMNNIGANLMQQGNINEAEKFFLKAVEIDDNYPNTHYALGMIESIKGNDKKAFNNTINAILKNKHKNEIYRHSLKQAFELARKIILTDTGKNVIKQYLSKLEFEGEKSVEIVVDDNIPTAAKLELAENYNREKHTVRYKEDYPGVDHLIMHELMHLEFVINARKNNTNQLFVSNADRKKEFIKSLSQSIKYLSKLGYSDIAISDVVSELFDGLNRQIYNTPIDLFIENKLYHEYSDLRPIQFISLMNMNQEGLKAVTDKDIVKFAPKSVLSHSKVYNIVNAIQLKELYGVDLVDAFQATKAELTQARKFYDEYLEYMDDLEPAEEYELVKHWAEDLKLDRYFELINEKKYRERNDIDSLLTSIENDPMGLEDDLDAKKKDMELFQKSQTEIGENMAVVMFMVDALQFFEKKSKNEIKEIAFEIAMQGTMGYSPDKDGYQISKIPGKSFSGYHILAYYYISWALAVPEMLEQIQLPYDNEYNLALQLYLKE